MDCCYLAEHPASSLCQLSNTCADLKAATGTTEDVFQHGHIAHVLKPFPTPVGSWASKNRPTVQIFLSAYNSVLSCPTFPSSYLENQTHQKKQGDFPGGSVVKNLLSNAGDAGLTSGWETRIPTCCRATETECHNQRSPNTTRKTQHSKTWKKGRKEMRSCYVGFCQLWATARLRVGPRRGLCRSAQPTFHGAHVTSADGGKGTR